METGIGGMGVVGCFGGGSLNLPFLPVRELGFE